MADFGQPATPNYTAPDGLATLGNLMSLKQKQQGLIGQQSTNQILAGQAVNAQQSAKETQAGAQLLSDPVGNGLVDSDGNPTKDAQTIIMKSMPTTGSEHYENIVKAAGSKVNFNNSINNLRAGERKEVADTISGAAADHNASPLTIKSQLEGLVESKKGTPVYDDYKKIADISTGIVAGAAHAQQSQGKIIPAGQEAFRQAALGLGRTVLGSAGVVGAGGVAAPQNAILQTGATQQPVVEAPALSGGGVTKAGPPIANTIPPGWSMTEDPITHNKYMVNQQTGQSHPLAGAAGPADAPPQRTAGQGESEVATVSGQAKGVGERVEQAKAQANNTIQTQDALGRALHILDSGAAANTGVGFDARKGIKNFLAGVGVDTKGADDTNSLVKNLARYEASRATAAGLGGTDAARELSHNGSPNTNIDNAALKGIVRQSLATEKAISAYAGIQSKSANPQQLMKNENDFRNIPNLVQGYEYGLTKSPQEANEFLEKHGISRDDMKKTRGMIKEFESR